MDHERAVVNPSGAGRALRAHVETWRPYTLWYIGLVGLGGAALVEGPHHPWRLAAAWLAPTVGWLGGQYLGDYFDRDLDAISKPHRPIPSRRLGARTAVWCGAACFALLAVLAGLGGWGTTATALIGAFGIVAYSRWFKARGFAGNLVRGALGALALGYGALSVGLTSAPPSTVAALGVLVVAFWCHDAMSNLVGTLRDVDGDRAGGFETLPVRRGAPFAAWTAVGLYTLTVTAAIVGGMVAGGDGRATYVVTVLVAAGMGVAALAPIVARRADLPASVALDSHSVLVAERVVLASALVGLGLGADWQIILAGPMVAVTWWTNSAMRTRYEFGAGAPGRAAQPSGAAVPSRLAQHIRAGPADRPRPRPARPNRRAAMTHVAADRLDAVIEAAAEALLRRQRPDGAFGDLAPASILGTAGTVAALHAADPVGCADLIEAGTAWLVEQQHSDGGWGGVVGADSEVVATAVAIAALGLTAPATNAPAIAAGRRWLTAHGGVDSVKDRAISLLCRQLLTMAGMPEQAGRVRRLPLEIVLFDRVRRQRISFRTSPFIALALMQASTLPAPGPLRRATLRRARPVALRLLRSIFDHEGGTGAMSEDPWPAALVLLGLARAGEAPDMVEAIVGWLRRAVRPDGAWDAVTNLDLTRSGYAATGLIAAGYGADPRLRSTRELFHTTQKHKAFDVLDVPPGGWSYSNVDGWPVTLESAEILSALAGFRRSAGQSTGRDPDDPVLRSGIEWLLGRQDTRGSWSLWVRDTKLPNDGPCPAITSQAIVALHEAGYADDHPAVAAAAAWLLTQQRPDGTFESLWYRDDTSGTAVVVGALSRVGHGGHEVVRRSVRWLCDTQLPDGSWGPGDGTAGSVEETSWAVQGLLATGDPTVSGPVERAVAWLVAAAAPDGGWSPTPICNYIRHYMRYPNAVITQAVALAALAGYREATSRRGVAGAQVRPGASPATTVDVVVAGAAAGGLAAARALGALGLDVLVLERNRTPTPIAKGEILQPDTARILDGWELLDALRATGARPVGRLAIRDPEGQALLSLDYGALPGPHRQILCADYTSLQSVLADGLPSTVEVRRGVRVTGAVRDDTGRVNGVRVVRDGVESEIMAPLVVAADGMSSALRKAAGVPVERREYPHRLVAFDVAGAEVADEVSAYRTARGLCLVYPLPDHRCRLYVQVRPDEFRGNGTSDLGRWLDQLLAEVPAIRPLQTAIRASLDRRQLLAVYRLRVPRQCVPGLALVGEAAHAVHPMAAQGVNSSLGDAEALAAALGARRPSPGALDPDSVDRALIGFAAARRSRLAHIATVSHNASRMITSVSGLPKLLGERMMRRTADNPRLLRLTAGNMSGTDPRPLSLVDRLFQLGLLTDRNAHSAPGPRPATPRQMTAPDPADTQRPDDLSMNETPYPPLPSIRRLLEDASAALHRYPDRFAKELRAALADRLGVGAEAIVVGPGSAGLCQLLMQSLGSKPDVVVPALSFEGYPLFIRNVGANGVFVAMDGYAHDLPAMAAAVTEQTRCVLVCNPNNPTGAALHRDELEAFLDRVPADVPVVIDEAYREFVTDPDVPDAMDLYRSHDNVCVLRTFSKAYGLATLRIGYTVLPPRLVPLAAMMTAVFFPGGLAQAAALASLQPQVTAELMSRCATLAESRARLIDALRDLGLTVAPSQANFVWLPLAGHANAFAAAARQAGILVVGLEGEGVRITIGSDPANERLLGFAKEFVAAHPGINASSDK
jgi:squalene-hopene/tetraprenyl-beta-curcumene cyclase